jgi:Fur family peroxide stress response transcriptional regulator
MKIDHNGFESRMRRFREAFKKSGAKMTHQRIEIFREVAQTEEHPDAVTIYERVRKRMPTISLDTVYRTLWMLMDMGLIATLGIHRGRVHFDGNAAIHHHFICTECGMTRDLHSDKLNNLQAPGEVKNLGRVETTHVEFRGLCCKCWKQDEDGRRTTA